MLTRVAVQCTHLASVWGVEAASTRAASPRGGSGWLGVARDGSGWLGVDGVAWGGSRWLGMYT
eukprot:1373224-Prymnesium_polylepis.1